MKRICKCDCQKRFVIHHLWASAISLLPLVKAQQLLVTAFLTERIWSLFWVIKSSVPHLLGCNDNYVCLKQGGCCLNFPLPSTTGSCYVAVSLNSLLTTLPFLVEKVLLGCNQVTSQSSFWQTEETELIKSLIKSVFLSTQIILHVASPPWLVYS